MKDRNYPTYKYRELLTAVGSDREVQDLIASYGFERPSLAVIRGWRSRNSIPSRWLPLIMQKVVRDGVLTDPAALMETPF
jgi:hypothetical protein